MKVFFLHTINFSYAQPKNLYSFYTILIKYISLLLNNKQKLLQRSTWIQPIAFNMHLIIYFKHQFEASICLLSFLIEQKIQYPVKEYEDSEGKSAEFLYCT